MGSPVDSFHLNVCHHVHCALFSGIQTSVVYWPAKITTLDRVVMFKLHFWDAGESALKKFDHVLPVRDTFL